MQGVTTVSAGRELTAQIGRNIRQARRQLGMSQNDVLRAQTDFMGPDDRPFLIRELSAWENGRHRPSDHYLTRIAAITGQTLGFFFESHDDPEV